MITSENMTEQQKIDIGFLVLESVWEYINWRIGDLHAARLVDKLSQSMLADVTLPAYAVAKFNASKWELMK